MNTNTPIKPADEPSSVTVQWALPARYIAAGLFIIGVIALLAFLSPIGADLAAGFLLAFLLDIPARALAKRTRLTYPRAAILIYLVIYVILAVLLIVGFNFFVEATQNILSDLKPAAESMFDTLENTSSQAIDGRGHRRSVQPSVAPAEMTMRSFRLSRRPAAPTAFPFLPALIRLHNEASDATIRKR